jgi:hypothetical protein
MSTRVRALIVTTLAALVAVVLLGWHASNEESSLDFLSGLIGGTLISFILFLGTLWVLFFKKKGPSFFTVALFPAIVILPYTILAESVVSSLFTGLRQLPIIVIAAAVFWLLTYLLLLTANVLNGAVLFNIPLGQAGKASQFIFSLVSTYLWAAYLFSASSPLWIRVVAISLSVFYFPYSALWVAGVDARELWQAALLVGLLIIVLVVVLSIWPVTSVYATLSIVVVFYTVLNVALEMRENLSAMVWFEHAFLILLVLVILFTNASWGMNGTLF